jgi:hypothetical protein
MELPLLDSAAVVDEQLDVPPDRGRGDVFETAARAVDPSKWREYWSQGAPYVYRDPRLSPGALPLGPRCVVKSHLPS